jgi:hypothetical protein
LVLCPEAEQCLSKLCRVGIEQQQKRISKRALR